MIKLIAFDMDESLMPRKGFYERERWARDFDLLRTKGIRVLPISGDQYQQVADFFPMKDEMTIGGLKKKFWECKRPPRRRSFLYTRLKHV